jgi:peptidoglycan/LPS O-acetylase OafA/YrhL
MKPSASADRSPRVDLLRGFAILSVLLLHFSLTYKLADSPLARLFPVSWIRAAINNGNYGVTLFFVISGFLITSNNLRRYGALGQVSLKQFYSLRFARIIPPLVLALAIIVPLGLLHSPSFDNSHDGQIMPVGFFAVAVLSVLTFWHNVLMESAGYFNYCLNIYWSLSVEEVFYLVFPLACLLLRRDVLIAALCVLAIAVAPAYRALHSDDELFYMYGYAACFDAIAIGCLTALLSARYTMNERLGRPLRWLCALGLGTTYLVGFDGHEAFGFTCLALFAAPILLNALEPRPAYRFMGARLICWFGKHSYELYLYHIIILALLRDGWPGKHVAAAYKLPLLLAFVLGSVLIAAAASKYFAEPVNRRLRSLLLRGR